MLKGGRSSIVRDGEICLQSFDDPVLSLLSTTISEDCTYLYDDEGRTNNQQRSLPWLIDLDAAAGVNHEQP